jgi:uncharacterized protein YndB with AHSA1/START domain
VRIVLIVVLVLAGVAALVALVGALLPVGHRASASARLKASPETVWRLITGVPDFTAWRKNLQSVEPLSEEPLRWVEVDGHGQRMTIEVTESRPPEKLVTTIVDKNLPFGGSWTYQIRPENGGSTLTLTENGEVYNVFFRFMSRFVFGHTATMEDYLKHLRARLGE